MSLLWHDKYCPPPVKTLHSILESCEVGNPTFRFPPNLFSNIERQALLPITATTCRDIGGKQQSRSRRCTSPQGVDAIITSICLRRDPPASVNKRRRVEQTSNLTLVADDRRAGVSFYCPLSVCWVYYMLLHSITYYMLFYSGGITLLWQGGRFK